VKVGDLEGWGQRVTASKCDQLDLLGREHITEASASDWGA